MDPKGRKYSSSGTRNQGVRNWVVCTFCGCWGLLSLSSTDQLSASVCTQEKEATLA